MIHWQEIKESHPGAEAPSPIFWVDLGAALNHYRTLGVPRTASSQAIKQAFRGLVRQHHPDLHHESSRPASEALMKHINAAYSVLRSPIQRRAYDASLDSY